MFILTAKLNAKKIFAYLLATAVVLCMVFAFWNTDSASPQVNGNTENVKVKSNEDRINFLKALNIEASPDPVEFMEIKIPDQFDQVFEKYNQLQQSQNYDLSKFAGKRVMRYTYDVKNYSTDQAARVNLLIYKDKVIGGDVCSVELGGFMHRLNVTGE